MGKHLADLDSDQHTHVNLLPTGRSCSWSLQPPTSWPAPSQATSTYQLSVSLGLHCIVVAVCVCVCLCMYVCLAVDAWTNNLSLSLKKISWLFFWLFSRGCLGAFSLLLSRYLNPITYNQHPLNLLPIPPSPPPLVGVSKLCSERQVVTWMNFFNLHLYTRFIDSVNGF